MKQITSVEELNSAIARGVLVRVTPKHFGLPECEGKVLAHNGTTHTILMMNGDSSAWWDVELGNVTLAELEETDSLLYQEGISITNWTEE